MKINKLKVNAYGVLKDKEIELSDGINIIYGENESGKSTLLKFIINCFYGTSKNKKGKDISDFDQYKPWQGEEFSGKLSYTLDNNKTYEIFREFKKKNPKIYNKNSEDISKQYTIDKTKGNQFFYEQTKIQEDLFVSSFATLQQETKMDEKIQNSIIQKMSNMVGTGEDKVSYQKAVDALNKKQLDDVGTEKSREKPINIVERKMQDLKQEKQELEEIVKEKYEIEEKKESLKNKIKQTENTQEIINKLEKIQEINRLEEEKEKIKNELIEKNKLQINEIEKDIKNKESKEKSERNNTKKYKNLLNVVLPIISIIVSIAIIISFVIIKNIAISSVLIGIFTICIACICGNKIKISKLKKEQQSKIKKIKEEKQKLENEKEVIQKNNINIKQELEKQKKENTLKIDLEKENIKNIYNIDDIELKTLWNNGYVEEIKRENTDKLNQNKLMYHQAELEEKNIEKQSNRYIEIKEELDNLSKQHSDLENLKETINLTKEILEKAYEKMKNNVTPKFTKNLSETINKLSNGKYNKVTVNDEKGLMVELENGEYIPADRLSIGTIDQLYLSLRLSMAEEISDEKMPIILDEAFAYFDDYRLENALKFLIDELKENQIILFTCTKREEEILNKLNIRYNLVEL